MEEFRKNKNKLEEDIRLLISAFYKNNKDIVISEIELMHEYSRNTLGDK